MKNNFKKEINKIEIPTELHRRIELGIQKAKQELTQQKQTNGVRMKRLFPRAGGAIAAFVLVIMLVIAVEPSVASSVKGFFKDIANWKGTVIGTEYKLATGEIKVEISQPNIKTEKVVVPISITILQGNSIPYSEIEAITLGEFKVVGSSGETLHEQEVTVQAIAEKEYSFEIQDSGKLLSETITDDNKNKKFQAHLIIQKDFFESNNHLTLKINSFYGHKKADAPLEIKGEWETLIK